jgi:hypothetical protein
MRSVSTKVISHRRSVAVGSLAVMALLLSVLASPVQSAPTSLTSDDSLRLVPSPPAVLSDIQLDRTGAHLVATGQKFPGPFSYYNFPVWLDTYSGSYKVVSPIGPDSPVGSDVRQGHASGISDDGQTVAGVWGNSTFAWNTSTGFKELGSAYGNGWRDTPSLSGDGTVVTAVEPSADPASEESVVRSTNVLTGVSTTIGPSHESIADAILSRDNNILFFSVSIRQSFRSVYELHRLDLRTGQDTRVGTTTTNGPSTL